MDSDKKTLVRQGLIAAGFHRANYSRQFFPQGPYQETWTAKDGSTVVLDWASNVPEAPCPHDEQDHSICPHCGEDRDPNSEGFGSKA